VWILAGAAALVLGLGVAAFAFYKLSVTKPTSPPLAGSPTRLRLLVPAYFYPGGKDLAEWDRLIDSPAAADTVVIVNTANGPGDKRIDDYAKVLERAKDKQLTVIGYVSTKYGKDRTLAEVKQDVDRWLEYYPGLIRGIFLDEQASAADQVTHYAALYEYVRKDKGLSLVVSNPGTVCAEGYFSRPATDVACLVEANKDFGAYHRPAWTDRYPAERFAALLTKVTTPEQMRQVLREMRDRKIGYGFVTDADGANPWGRLPGYWDEEAAAVQQANAGVK
jgi:hypothetical protein